MYDKKRKCWITLEPVGRTDSPNGEVTAEDALYADYARADESLTKATAGTRNVEAVYLMEKTAKQGYAPACLAMAQMFEFGWAVAKSSKMAVNWYQKAAEAGSEEAKAYIERLKKAKRQKRVVCCVAAAAVVIVISLFAAGILRLPGDNRLRITLPKGIELETPSNTEQYAEIIIDMQKNYDTEEMRNGSVNTNRIMFVYFGNNLNLSKFDIVAAATDGELTILQFTNREEALRCYEYLEKLPDTVAIDLDQYVSMDETTAADNSLTAVSGSVPTYHSDISGYDYYSWGAIAMEMDQYAAYLSKIASDKHITVAVVDSGIEPNAETEDRIVDGTHFVFKGNGKTDKNSHGTHVSGIILNCTQGLNVDVMSVGVFGEKDKTDIGLIINGFRYAAEEADVQVINMSLGGGHNNLKDYYVKEAIDRGIVVVVSSGNTKIPIDIDYYGHCPAHITQAITVGAIDINGDIASFSNYGDSVDVCAPGYEVLSYVPAPNYFGYMDGTSMAAPHVAALAAMILLEYENLTPAQVERCIKAYSNGCGNDKRYYGEGLPLAGNFVEIN